MLIWNARLCQELLLPLQAAEITVRNAVARRLADSFGQGWYSSAAFIKSLQARHAEDLRALVRLEQNSRGKDFSVDHVIAGLKFGFWVQLLSKQYDKWLRARDIQLTFPNISSAHDRSYIHTRVDQLRVFRNKVAHHYAIFDRDPLKEYGNAMSIIGWICRDTAWFVRQLCNPQALMAARPVAA
jgi:hypothetical protein